MELWEEAREWNWVREGRLVNGTKSVRRDESMELGPQEEMDDGETELNRTRYVITELSRENKWATILEREDVIHIRCYVTAVLYLSRDKRCV
jgi:hypothetical protein